jgi:hypothetical protein
VVTQTLVVVKMDVNHQLRVGEPSADEDLVPGSGSLLDAIGIALDGIVTFLNSLAPELIGLVGMNEIGRYRGHLCLYRRVVES